MDELPPGGWACSGKVEPRGCDGTEGNVAGEWMVGGLAKERTHTWTHTQQRLLSGVCPTQVPQTEAPDIGKGAEQEGSSESDRDGDSALCGKRREALVSLGIGLCHADVRLSSSVRHRDTSSQHMGLRW